MGYAAVVHCNCYRDGKASEPPHKEYVRVDDGSVYLDLGGLGLDKNTALAWYLDFDSWLTDACIHPDMDYAYEHLQNMSGMSNFRSTLAALGAPQRFPVLNEYLPISNDGTLPAIHAAVALQELDTLANEYTAAFDSPQLVLVGVRHEYIVNALRKVLTASLETGNPVIWT